MKRKKNKKRIKDDKNNRTQQKIKQKKKKQKEIVETKGKYRKKEIENNSVGRSLGHCAFQSTGLK
jgi:hypothetical protein